MARKRPRVKQSPASDPLLDFSDYELRNYIFANLTTPPRVDKYVSEFCRKLSPKERPVFLTVQPPNWSRQDYCNKNVERMIQLHGGGMSLGYKIWYVPSLYIEAERHAVWLNPEGELVDITFNKDGETNILFLPMPMLKAIPARAFTKPRDSFHSRVAKTIEQKVRMEKFESRFEKVDDTWEGWERAPSFESWLQRQQGIEN